MHGLAAYPYGFAAGTKDRRPTGGPGSDLARVECDILGIGRNESRLGTTDMITREVIILRVRCPFCGGAGHRIYRSEPRGFNGDRVRYARCRQCDRRFHIIETDDDGKLQNVPQRGIQSFNRDV